MVISKTLKKQLNDARKRVWQLEQDYKTQMYLETMPEYSPAYKYCFTTSNFTIPFDVIDIDAWLRAIIKHMATRPRGHGGAYTDAVVISIPKLTNTDDIERWLGFMNEVLRKKVTSRRRSKLQQS
jgi:hypothetical protein